MADQLEALIKIMSLPEAKCYAAAKRWQRTAITRQLKRNFIPCPPYFHRFKQGGLFFKLVYLLLVVAISPLLVIAYVLRAIGSLLVFPFKYYTTYRIPADLRPPGERNIQGIQHSFSRFFELPNDLYISCVEDWITILYGSEAQQSHRMEFYLDLDRILNDMGVNELDAELDRHYRRHIDIAREKLSQELGHY